MTAQEMQKIHESTFERIRRTNQYGQDYWSARALRTVLGYSKWDKFLLVIEKARQAGLRQFRARDNQPFSPNGENGGYRLRSAKGTFNVPSTN